MLEDICFDKIVLFRPIRYKHWGWRYNPSLVLSFPDSCQVCELRETEEPTLFLWRSFCYSKTFFPQESFAVSEALRWSETSALSDPVTKDSVENRHQPEDLCNSGNSWPWPRCSDFLTCRTAPSPETPVDYTALCLLFHIHPVIWIPQTPKQNGVLLLLGEMLRNQRHFPERTAVILHKSTVRFFFLFGWFLSQRCSCPWPPKNIWRRGAVRKNRGCGTRQLHSTTHNNFQTGQY